MSYFLWLSALMAQAESPPVPAAEPSVDPAALAAALPTAIESAAALPEATPLITPSAAASEIPALVSAGMPGVYWLWIAAGAVVVTACGIILYRRLRKSKSASVLVASPKDEPAEVPHGERTPAEKEFAGHAETFAGLYEPLFQAAAMNRRPRKGFLGDWLARTENLSGASNYTALWTNRLSSCMAWEPEEAAAQSRELLAFVTRAGVSRSRDQIIAVNGLTYSRYEANGARIEEGRKARVIVPYWYITRGGEMVLLDKGIIEPADDGANQEDGK
jgi:hypothetical protein